MRKTITIIILCIFTFTLFVGNISGTVKAKQAGKPLYMNEKAPDEERIKALLKRMTIDEKVGQMIQAERASVTPNDVKEYKLGSVLSGGGSFPDGKEENSTREKWSNLVDSYQSGAVSTRLGIPLLYGADAVHGHNNVKGATIFPHNIGLGATRNTKLIEKIGHAAASEIKSTGVNWTFAPTMANVQNIRWGRTYEGFGENSKLVANMGAAYIDGLQGKNLKKTENVLATAKHFIGEGYTKGGVNQGDVTEYTEEEILKNDRKIYEEAIESGARTVMASFHSIEGLKMHANKRLLTDVLKKDMGFTGFVISDWYGIQQITKDQNGNAVSGLKQQIEVAVNAGVDMLMQPENWKETLRLTKELVNEGGISEKRLDDAVTRILRVKFESGVFEKPMTDPKLAKSFGSEKNREIARQSVSESLVLLKNDKVNGKPILSQLKKMDKIFVAGRSADDIGKQSGGWTISWQGKSGDTTEGTTILEGLKEVGGKQKKITYNKHGRGAKGNDAAIVVVGEEPYAETDGDATDLHLNRMDLLTLENVRKADPNIPIVVVLVSGRPMIITDEMKDWSGLVAAWLPGTEGAGVADVLLGGEEFSGKLPVSWPFYLEAYENRENKKDHFMFNYGYGLTKKQATPKLPEKPELPEKPGLKVPGKIEAEDFAAQYGLQTENSSEESLNMGYADARDWLEYEINVEQDGLYQADFRYAANLSGQTGINIVSEEKKLLGKLRVGSTGGWQNWDTSTVDGVILKKGKQKIKFEYIEGSLNLNWFDFKRVGNIPATPPPTEDVPAEVIKAKAVESWITNEREPSDVAWYFDSRYQPDDKKLSKQEKLDITKPDASNLTTINIDPTKQYQSILGIGSSMDESTVHNLTKMSPDKRQEVLDKLIDPDKGIGMSLIRTTIGTSDFTAQEFYTYDDMPPGKTDVNLKHFSIQKDIDYKIIETLKQIKEINPDVTFFASPWSPPGWMKTSDSMIKGQVKDEYLPILAKYYLKYFQAYKKQGIDISAMTLQNEPMLEIEYPSTNMPYSQAAELAALLRKELDNNGFKHVKLWGFDHNPSDTGAYAEQLLKDKGAYDALDGTAFHDYGGSLSEMTRLHNLFPQKNVYLTERAVWGTYGADRIAQYMRNWARSYNSWVVMLDSDIQTHQWVGQPDPTLLIQDSADRDNYWLTPEYYLTGHFSKFVKPGFTRVESDYGSSDTVTNVTFLSPDQKTLVSIVINQSYEPQKFKFISEGEQIKGELPAKSVATYQWQR
ncbi:glycoside hydrolase family 3 N-terminal domain-containing protein [Peribacillus simplex]